MLEIIAKSDKLGLQLPNNATVIVADHNTETVYTFDREFVVPKNYISIGIGMVFQWVINSGLDYKNIIIKQNKLLEHHIMDSFVRYINRKDKQYEGNPGLSKVTTKLICDIKKNISKKFKLVDWCSKGVNINTILNYQIIEVLTNKTGEEGDTWAINAILRPNSEIYQNVQKTIGENDMHNHGKFRNRVADTEQDMYEDEINLIPESIPQSVQPATIPQDFMDMMKTMQEQIAALVQSNQEIARRLDQVGNAHKSEQAEAEIEKLKKEILEKDTKIEELELDIAVMKGEIKYLKLEKSSDTVDQDVVDDPASYMKNVKYTFSNGTDMLKFSLSDIEEIEENANEKDRLAIKELFTKPKTIYRSVQVDEKNITAAIELARKYGKVVA